jgi:hypothetical protein
MTIKRLSTAIAMAFCAFIAQADYRIEKVSAFASAKSAARAKTVFLEAESFED